MTDSDSGAEIIKVAIIADCDYQDKPLGGVVALLNNMLCADGTGHVDFHLIGISFDTTESEGLWQNKKIKNKIYRWMPVYVCPKAKDDTKFPLRLRLVAGIRKYWQSINFKNFDAIYIHSAEIMLSLSSINVPVICHVHGDPLITVTRSRFPLLRHKAIVKQYDKLIHHAFDRSAGIIWAANACKLEYYRRLKVAEFPRWDIKSTTIYSSVDPVMFNSNSSEFCLSLSDNAKKLVTVSRLSEVKHIDFLLEVFAYLTRTYNNLSFYIAGEGECASSLKETAKNLGCLNQVHFLGSLNKNQLAGLLGEMDVFLFASESEAMSLVVLESMAAGVPVVSTRVGDLDEVVSSNTGAIVEGRNLTAFSDAVNTCLKNGKVVYADACIATAREFSAEKMRENIEGFIEQCVR